MCISVLCTCVAIRHRATLSLLYQFTYYHRQLTMTCDKPVIVEHVFLGRKSTLLDSYLIEMPLCTRSLFNHQLLHVTKIYRLNEERAHLKTGIYHHIITRY